MLKGYPELKKSIIGLALSVAVLIGLISCVAVLRRRNPHVPMNEASITISEVTVEKGAVKLDWECDNVGVTSYRVYRKTTDTGSWDYYDSVHKKCLTDNDVNNKKIYGYYVEAYDSRKKSQNKIVSPYIYIYIDFDSDHGYQKMSEIKPQLTAKVEGGKVKFSWKPIANVPLTYMGFYYEKEDGSWALAKTLPANNFSYEEEKRGTRYKIVGRNISGKTEKRTAEIIIDLESV